MAQPTVIPGTKLLILVGDSASPEVFSQPCGLTTRSFKLSASTNSTLIPDCDDGGAPAWEAKDVNGLSAQISGAGVLAVEAYAFWRNWFMNAVAKNAQVKLDAPGLGYYAGSFILTNFEHTGTRGQKVAINVTMDNDQAVTWVDVP
ncbi:MAG: phage tail protein [Rhizobiales bacterium]|nr:phage tail protein [Hyphomicrobiales bacterium]